VAERTELVITMLPDSSAVREVVFGVDGVLGGLRAGGLLVDMSTIHPAVAVEVATAAAQQRAAALDAPVSGGDVGAQAGTLSIMAGGEPDDVERARPLFDVLGSTIVHVGGAGAGQVVKACNQIVVGATIAAVSEALVLGSKAGVDPARVLEVLNGGLAASRVIDVRGRNFLEHDFTPGFRIDLHHKDLKIALDSGDEFGVALPTTTVVAGMLRTLRTKGRGGDDHSGLLQLLEDWAEHRITHDGTSAGLART
jgi:2-hydroxy-3-oxopropionate reductase